MIGEDMHKHLDKLQLKIYQWSCKVINLHKTWIENSLKFCTLKCAGQIFTNGECDRCRLKRALIVVWVLICNVIIITILGMIMGAIFFLVFLIGLGVLSFGYSPFISLIISVGWRKVFQMIFLLLLGLYREIITSLHWKNLCCFMVCSFSFFLSLLASRYNYFYINYMPFSWDYLSYRRYVMSIHC